MIREEKIKPSEGSEGSAALSLGGDTAPPSGGLPQARSAPAPIGFVASAELRYFPGHFKWLPEELVNHDLI